MSPGPRQPRRGAKALPTRSTVIKKLEAAGVSETELNAAFDYLRDGGARTVVTRKVAGAESVISSIRRARDDLALSSEALREEPQLHERSLHALETVKELLDLVVEDAAFNIISVPLKAWTVAALVMRLRDDDVKLSYAEIAVLFLDADGEPLRRALQQQETETREEAVDRLAGHLRQLVHEQRQRGGGLFVEWGRDYLKVIRG